ncbi:MAG: hypothetical protein HYY14_06955 [Candidatus Omnitrophica bacterium]|nr:hypothetical protein [Candidatus Omnitrophota bacterium]
MPPVLDEKSPVLAAFLSLFVAGLGQIYNGQVKKGVVIFLTFWLVIPWAYGVYDACVTARRINMRELIVEVPTLKSLLWAGGIYAGAFFAALVVMLFLLVRTL